MKRYLPFIIIALVGLGTAAGGTMLYRAKHARIAAVAARTAADNIGGNPGANPAHAHGPDNAPVTIEEFGDFQCPPCAALASLLRTFEHDYPGKLRVVFRQYPLEMYNANGTLLTSNDDWKDQQREEIKQTGLAPKNDREAAILAPVAPGAYTIVMRGANNTTGTGLVEVYDIK